MNIIDVIGVGLGYADITEKHHEIIRRAEVLVGGKRHLSWFPDHPAEKRPITAPVDDVIADICHLMKNRRVVVLASGDPLFYGIGETLISKLGNENIVIHPNVSVMTAAFSRIGRTWKDAVAVSIHGRGDNGTISAALDENRPVFVFTDDNNTPLQVARIAFSNADRLLAMWVFERLGEIDERITKVDMAEAAQKEFNTPNAVILLPERRESQDELPRPSDFLITQTPVGNPDNAFAHDAGMITKEEVRAVSIAKLRLKPHHVLWDLGSGSGAVAIEAAAILTTGQVAAVEKNPHRILNIQENIRRFKVDNVDVHQLTLPDGIASLPRPDRIFIGGGGKNLPEIIQVSADRLAPGGRMVINAVVLETVAGAMAELEKNGFSCQAVCIQVSDGARMPSGTRFCAKNPVFVISAQKPADNAQIRHDEQTFPVLFVGAGPGDPELITVKGKNALESADLVIYAGSLVPEAALAWIKPGTTKENSANMHLDEFTARMAEAQIAGKRVVRLHSGDPSLYGAIAEQMNALEKKKIPFKVIPGVTAAFAAAAALKIEYTVPEKTQTLILTRAEGRTPVPAAEHLEHLAAHGAAMAIYLSAGLAEKVEAALVDNYGSDAPVAVVYRASRPDETIFRTTAGNLSKTMSENNITATALILTGPALGENRGITAVSKLYDKAFTHGCRKGTT